MSFSIAIFQCICKKLDILVTQVKSQLHKVIMIHPLGAMNKCIRCRGKSYFSLDG